MPLLRVCIAGPELAVIWTRSAPCCGHGPFVEMRQFDGKGLVCVSRPRCHNISLNRPRATRNSPLGLGLKPDAPKPRKTNRCPSNRKKRRTPAVHVKRRDGVYGKHRSALNLHSLDLRRIDVYKTMYIPSNLVKRARIAMWHQKNNGLSFLKTP